MATNKRISALDAGAALTGAEVLPVVQSGAASNPVKVTTQAIADLSPDTLAELTDISSYDLPTLNAPLSIALAGKANTTGVGSGNYLISGGGVGFISGLDLLVSAASYVIGGVAYSSVETSLTATTADATNDRIDVVVVDDAGVASIIAGTPGATPEKPDVDPGTQLELTFFLVAAAATVLDVTTLDVYHENTEWTTSKSGAPITLASTNNPRAGTVCVEGTAVTAGNYVNFRYGSTLDPNNIDSLVFYIRSKAAWPATRSLAITLRATGVQRGVAVSLKSGVFGFDSSVTASYQQIVIPLDLFGAGGLLVNDIRITGVGTGATFGFYLDDVELQSGVAPTADSDRMRWRGTYAAAVAYIVNDVVVSGDIPYVCIAPATNRTPASSATYWAAMTTAAGTVSSVGVTAPAAGITSTGGPITSSGAITLALADDLAAVEGLATTGLVRRTAANTWSAGTAVDLTAEVTGILPVANMATGTPSGTKFIRDDGTLAVPASGTGDVVGPASATGNNVVLFDGATGKLIKDSGLALSGSNTGDQTSVTGNAGTATALQTARTIGGVSFDGSANISQPFDVHAFYPGAPTASALLLRVPVARAVGFVANFAGSYSKAGTAATASTVFDIQKNGVSIGTATFAAAGTTATFASASGAAQALAAGDVLSIIAPATPDSTLADAGFVLAGTR